MDTRQRSDTVAPMDTQRSDDNYSAMTLAMRVGEEMLESNVSVSEVEHTVARLVRACGLERCEVSVTVNVVTLCDITDDGTPPVTLMKVVNVAEPRLDRLSELERIVRRVEQGELDIDSAAAVIDDMDSAAPPWNPTARLAAAVIAAAAWVVFAGGGLWGAAAGAVAAVAYHAVRRAAPAGRVPDVFIVAAGAVIAVASPAAFAVAGAAIALGPAITGALYPLLPGGMLVGAVTDGMSGSPVSSIAKTLQAAITAVAIAGGVIAALGAVDRLGITGVDRAAVTPTWILGVAAVVAIAAYSVSQALPARYLFAVCCIAAAAWATNTFLDVSRGNIPVSTFVAAGILGVGGALAGRFTATTQALYTACSVYVLVPGFTFYTAMVAFAGGDTQAGIERSVDAFAIALAIAAGIAAGASIGRSLPSPRAKITVWAGEARDAAKTLPKRRNRNKQHRR